MGGIRGLEVLGGLGGAEDKGALRVREDKVNVLTKFELRIPIWGNPGTQSSAYPDFFFVLLFFRLVIEVNFSMLLDY